MLPLSLPMLTLKPQTSVPLPRQEANQQTFPRIPLPRNVPQAMDHMIPQHLDTVRLIRQAMEHLHTVTCQLAMIMMLVLRKPRILPKVRRTAL
jgi:hypothetical protein